jgi:ribosomal peptide maturation radical SAM protein 1
VVRRKQGDPRPVRGLTAGARGAGCIVPPGAPRDSEGSDGATAAMRTLLIDMPFGLVERPALGLSLLKPELERCGCSCDISYANHRFSAVLGAADYRRVADDLPDEALAGEWVFAEALFGPGAAPLREFGALLLSRWGQRPDLLPVLQRARALAESFVEEVVDSIDWAAYRLVGFTSSCHQNLAALAVARSVKAEHPHVTIAFGGPNWDGEMGLAQLRAFGFVDFACVGEADESLPELARRLIENGEGPLPDGVAGRVDGHVELGGPGPRPPADLDELPLPDFRDYVAALAAGGLAGSEQRTVSVEASRGCWWSGRGPCSFCGQNGTSRVYREKSPGRVLDELLAAAGRCPGATVELTDNVVSPNFLRDVLPRVAGTALEGKLFFEARPTITKADVALLAALGCRVQFGIESFCDHTLDLMRKGVRGLENLRLLKWCRIYGVRPAWNILYGVPGEIDGDLEAMLAILPRVRFLTPPRHCAPVRLQRFSPLFEEAARSGLRDLRPVPSYGRVYPFPDDVLRDIAYFFDVAEEVPRSTAALRFRLRKEVERWQGSGDAGTLRRDAAADGAWLLRDTRDAMDARVHVLDPLSRRVLDECDDIATRGRLLEVAESDGVPANAARLDASLRSLVSIGALVGDGERYLSLALPVSAVTPERSTSAVSRAAGSMPRAE